MKNLLLCTVTAVTVLTGSVLPSNHVQGSCIDTALQQNQCATTRQCLYDQDSIQNIFTHLKICFDNDIWNCFPSIVLPGCNQANAGVNNSETCIPEIQTQGTILADANVSQTENANTDNSGGIIPETVRPSTDKTQAGTPETVKPSTDKTNPSTSDVDRVTASNQETSQQGSDKSCTNSSQVVIPGNSGSYKNGQQVVIPGNNGSCKNGQQVVIPGNNGSCKNGLQIVIIPGNGSCTNKQPSNESETKKPQSNESETKKPQTTENETKKPSTSKPENNKQETTTEKPSTSVEDTQNLSYVEQVVALVNQERRKAGLSEVVLDKNITAAAQIRAKEIVQSFSHTRPNGSNFSTVLKEQGISYRGAGENIAWGQKSPQEVMNGWMNSSGHRANILNANYTKIGVGYYQSSNGTKYWSQLFTY